MELSLPIKLLLSLALGAVIGLEREFHEKKTGDLKENLSALIGVRTFALITMLGCIAGSFAHDHLIFFMITTIGVFALLLINYIFSSLHTNDLGITTEIAAIYAYTIGVTIATELYPVQLIIALTVILVLVLSRKATIKSVIGNLQQNEINALISFGIVALVILPFLPNQSFTLTNIPVLTDIIKGLGFEVSRFSDVEIINPFKMWFIVALITGVDLVGYTLQKTIGQSRGWLLTSIAGGFISSTATTQSLAQRSKKSNSINLLVAAAIFANLASFFQLIVLLAPLNITLLVKLLPIIFSIIIAALLLGFFFLRLQHNHNGEELEETKNKLNEGQIFSLAPAIKFALLFLIIRIISKIGLQLFGESGFLITSTIAATTGLDAVTINLADAAGKLISFQTAAFTLILVNAVNLFTKSLYSLWQAKREFALKFSISMIIIVAFSLLGLFFI